MMHNIITRRAAELEDLVEGMNEFGLIDLLHNNTECVKPALFPRASESIIDKEEVKSLIKLEEDSIIAIQAVGFLCQ